MADMDKKEQIRRIARERVKLLAKKYSTATAFTREDRDRLVELTEKLNILVPRVPKEDGVDFRVWCEAQNG